ncbi:MAG: hypothetical protein J7L71_11745, partial [Spirochaetaceae bacterium]|nr:hypothetical protein [Spirochaetaceae bacterium]
ITLEFTKDENIKNIFQKLDAISSVDIKDSKDQIKIKLTTSKDIRSDIYRLIKSQEWILLEMVQETESLEHIFKELTKGNDKKYYETI